jgi:hypothetical protein
MSFCAEIAINKSDPTSDLKETMIQTEVTYTLAHGGKFYLVEHVPARVWLPWSSPATDPSKEANILVKS